MNSYFHKHSLAAVARRINFCAFLFLTTAIAPSQHVYAGVGSSTGADIAKRATVDPSRVAVYLSLKLPKGMFVLAGGRSAGENVRVAMEDMAEDREMSLAFPTFEDVIHEALTAARISARDGAGLQRIARSHGAGAALSGRAVKTADGVWTVAWMINTDRGSLKWDLPPGGLAQALANGLDKISGVQAGLVPLQPYPAAKPRSSKMIDEGEGVARDVEEMRERPSDRPLEEE